MTKTKTKEKKDTRMVADYFENLEKYKEKYGEKTILLWQCGSFYEIYSTQDPNTLEYLYPQFNDFLNITHMNSAGKNMNYKTKGINYPVKMAGFTATDYYLQKYTTILVNEGYTVPVWYESGNIGKKRERRELHIFSPGTNFCVEKKTDTNVIACYSLLKNDKGFINKNPTINFGCSCIDIFTGNVKLFEHSISRQNLHNPNVFDELERFNSIYNPIETIIIHNYEDNQKIENIVQFASLQTKSIHIINCNDDSEQSKLANQCEEQTYQKKIFTDFYDNIPDYDAFLETSQLNLHTNAYKSLCFLLDFIFQHNPNLTHKLHLPSFDNITNRLFCGNHSLVQLNIVNPNNVKGQYSSIVRLINKCITPMGRRYFKDKILHPVTDIKYLNTQYDIIGHILENYEMFIKLRKKFINIKDIEHLYRKIIFNKVSPFDLSQFIDNLHCILELNKILKEDKIINKYINENIDENIETTCKKLIDVLERNLNKEICETLSNNKFEINFFKSGINILLDKTYKEFQDIEEELNNIITSFSKIIQDRDSKAKDPIKLHRTEKSGMYLYATNKRCKILETAIDKMDPMELDINIGTVKFTSGSANGTSNKKIMGSCMTELYNKYIQKQDNLSEVLKNVYANFIRSLIKYDNETQNLVSYVSHLDMLITKAFISKKYNYCKPHINKKAKKSFFKAKNIRHPIIESLLMLNGNEVYVPNDIELGEKTNGMVIFGTNGVGKSSINRSVGISIIMAQSGMYVPCSEFIYKPYTSIYTRILGNDNIFKGLSTFAVEMCELATILNKCDKNSLILGDEVCSGTETSSAVSIFAQTLIDLQKIKATHVFATHFHEITKMNEIKKLKKLDIKHMSVQCDNNGVLHYTRKLEDGSGAKMYGLEVCKSFHFEESFLENAHALRRKYDKKSTSKLKLKKSRYNAKKLKGNCEFCNEEGVDIHHLEPQEKADVNNYIGNFHKNHPANLTNICKKCHDKYTKNKTVHRKTKTTEGYKLVPR